jgi:hypothetical protein
MSAEQITTENFKSLASSLNSNFKFNFGAMLPRFLTKKSQSACMELTSRDLTEMLNEKKEIDNFFSLFYGRLARSSLNDYSNFYKEPKKAEITFEKEKVINFSKNFELINRTHEACIESVPSLELPSELSCTLDNLLAYSVTQYSIERDESCRNSRKIFFNSGSCLFYKVSIYLIFLQSVALFLLCIFHG